MTQSSVSAMELLEKRFDIVEAAFLRGETIPAEKLTAECCELVFSSKTQAYREVLLGCLVTRLTDKTKDVHLPYASQGPSAFNARSLDENVVNPFLRAREVPCSTGPYLNVFRRQVRFERATREGVKDKKGFDALLTLVDWVGTEEVDQKLLGLLDHVLYRFLQLREEASVEPLALDRMSLRQYETLINGLLQTQSGGRFPVILVLAMIEAISERFELDWQVDCQGINVADKAAGKPGDITVRHGEDVLLTIEVTEREVDAHRIASTFEEKIAPRHLPDYVFLGLVGQIDESARELIERYFAQGYDVNVVHIPEWLGNMLVTVGAEGRRLFQERICTILRDASVPSTLRHLWNEQIKNVLSSGQTR